MRILFYRSMIAYTIISLFLPMNIFKFTSIYHSGSLFGIRYDWLDYDFSFLLIPIVLFGMIIYFQHFEWKYFIVPVIVFIQDIIRVYLVPNNIVDLNSYEMYLSYVSGLCAAFLCFYGLKHQQEKYFHVFWFLNVCTQFIRFLTNMSGIENRFNAINLDVVGTGEISGICLILLITSTNKWTWFERMLVPVYVISIFISGTRNPLVFSAILGFIYIFANFKSVDKTIKHVSLMIILLFISIIIYTIIGHDNRIYKTISDLLQFISFTQNSDMGLEHANSVIGRYDSMLVAIDVLKDYPLGVGNGFIILQSYMQEYGYPTFPHSYLLCGWMLWGIWVWVILGYGIYKFSKLIKCKASLKYLGLYLLMVFLLSGGPIVNFKTWFCYVFIILIISNKYHGRYVN